MSVSIQAKTSPNELISFISVLDDAIDWNASYLDFETEEDRKTEYRKTHDLSKLVLRKDAVPTYFVFKHPRRADITTEMRKLMSALNADAPPDLLREICDAAFLGTQEGSDAQRTPAPKVNGKITVAYLQGLEDAGVFVEICWAFAGEYHRASEALNKKSVDTLGK